MFSRKESKYNADSKEHQLFEAIKRGNFTKARTLVSHGVEVNSLDYSDSSPLMLTCRLASEQHYRDLEAVASFVDYLIKEGAYIRGTDIFGRSALDYLQENGPEKLRKQVLHALDKENARFPFW